MTVMDILLSRIAINSYSSQVASALLACFFPFILDRFFHIL